MSTIREAAQQALEALELTSEKRDPMRVAAISALRAALAKEEKAAAWLAERKEHWRKEKEKAQATKDHDPELSAALGWPGGIGDPVLDRTQLLQMVAEMRVAQQPEGGGNLPPPLQESTVAETATTQQPIEQTPPSEYRRGYWDGFAIGKREGRIEAEDALAQQPVPKPELINQCGETCERAKLCVACAQALEQPAPEPVAWECKAGGLRPLTQKHYDAQPDNIKRHYTRIAPPRCPNCDSLEAQNTELDRRLAEMERAEPVAWRFQSAVGGWAYGSTPPIGSKYPAYPLYAAPPKRKPLTDDEIAQAMFRADAIITGPMQFRFARAVEQAHGIKE